MENNKRIAIVTGANKGIGYAIVKRLCKDFDGIVYLTARNVENGKRAVESLNKLNLFPRFHQLDIENLESINKFASYLKETYNGVDIIINNAGLFIHKEDNLPLIEEAKITFSLNYYGTINLCNALFPLLRPNGRVINVSSRLGLLNKINNKALKDKIKSENLTMNDLNEIVNDYIRSCENGSTKKNGYPDTAYDMSKIALNTLTRLQQKEFEKNTNGGVMVFAACPGYCKTDATRGGGILTADVGAETAVWLALLPNNFRGKKGAMWAEKKYIDWENSPFICATFGMIMKAISSKFSRE